MKNNPMSTDESRFIIIKRDGANVKFLRHEGHNHYWTQNRTEAMEYTKLEVAQALADQKGGKVELDKARY